MSWLDQFFRGNAGAAGPQGAAGLGAEPEWSAGPIVLPKASIAGLYELVYANRTGSVVTLSGAYVNGGKSGMGVDAVNTTTIALVARALDGSGGDTAMGSYSNASVGLTAKGDTAIALSPATVPANAGVYVKLSIASTGTDLGAGTRVYLTL